METGALGKKIFFLHPPPVLTEVVDQLARQEFEVYLTRSHEKLRRSVASFPDAIVFVNLDDGLDEAGWLRYVKGLRAEAPAVGIGVITLNDDARLREHYLMNLQIQCGFVILKIGASKTAEILAKTLEANEARGRRKFVRALCAPGTGQCAMDHEGATLSAELTDLSSAGMAIRFEGGESVKVGSVLRDIALIIKGKRLLASGVIVAKRSGETVSESVHVVMFDPNSLDEARREKLKTLVFRINQAAMDHILESSSPSP
jgi:hypothetical protein